MRILHVTTHIGQGGDWSVIKNLADIFLEHAHEVFVAGANTNSCQYKSFEMPFNQGKTGFIAALKNSRELPTDIDIIHVHSPITLFFALFLRLTRYRKAKIIFTYHWLIQNFGFKSTLKKLLFKRADIIQCHAIDVYNFLRSEYELNKQQCRLIYVGADTQRFSLPSKQKILDAREAYQIPADKFLLLFAGRLAPEKNIIIVFKYLQQTTKNIIFLIAGDGDQRKELEALSRKLNIVDKVRFLGKITDIESVYAAADLLILPSSSMETFGMVVIEAALCGLPTLRSDLPGAVDQIDHGQNGFIFPNNDLEKMSIILDAACDNRYDLRSIGLRASEKTKIKFNLATMYSDFLQLYCE